MTALFLSRPPLLPEFGSSSSDGEKAWAIFRMRKHVRPQIG